MSSRKNPERKIPPGLILINKPPGITSFQLLSPLKKALGIKKVGHAGTLDKFATGLMLVFAGQGTRFVQYLSNMDKHYHARLEFGKETSTLDPEGEVTANAPLPDGSRLDDILQRFRGDIQQVPPKYSAVHVDGQRAYKRSLKGDDFEIPSRNVRIHSLTCTTWDPPYGEFDIHCSKGTYIRSFARDIGLALESRAYVTRLLRSRVGSFKLEDALSLDEIREKDPDWIIGHMICGSALIRRIPGFQLFSVDTELAQRMRQGKDVFYQDLGKPMIQKIGNSLPDQIYAAVDEQDELAALFQAPELIQPENRLRYRGVFHKIS